MKSVDSLPLLFRGQTEGLISLCTLMEISMFFKTTFTGNITFAEIVEAAENPFLKIVIATNDSNDNGVRVTVRTKNGLLKAAQDGENLVGQRIVVAGTIDLATIRSHYTQEGVNKTLKNPEFRVYADTIERLSRKAVSETPAQQELAV